MLIVGRNCAEIETELKKHCVPLLREKGFKGSFPDLYRDIDGMPLIEILKSLDQPHSRWSTGFRTIDLSM